MRVPGAVAATDAGVVSLGVAAVSAGWRQLADAQQRNPYNE